MPVDTKHPDFCAHEPEWQLMRDAIAGARQIKQKGEVYLPKLFQQPQTEYDDYKLRAVWFGATGRTAEAFLGMLTRKLPVVKSTGIDAILLDCDLQGNPFTAHCQSTLWELDCVARAGTLIDYSVELNRPYVTAYTTEQIWNWRYERVAGQVALTLLVLFEISSDYSPLTGQEAPDEYCTGQYEQWRELRLRAKGTPEAPTYEVVQRVFRKKIAGKDQPTGTQAMTQQEFVIISEVTLSRRGVPLTAIPFVPHGMGTQRMSPTKPILLDMAEVNAADYRNSADEENALHVAGLPTPWAAGFTDSNEQVLALGVSRAWVTDKENASCGFLEYTGAGVQSIREAKTNKREMMAAMGARILDAPQASAEATDTVKLRQTSESNVLTDLAASAEQSLSEVLRWLVWWNGTAEKMEELRNTVYLTINKDLLGSKLDAAMLSALVATFQGGGMSFATFFWNMQQGNMYPDGTTEEKEKEAIQQNPPPPPLPVDPNKKTDDPPTPAAK